MADFDAVNLGLDENEADIAEELQDFGDSFDTRSEASAESSNSSTTNPSITSVSTDSSVKSKNRRAHLKRERSINGATEQGISSVNNSVYKNGEKDSTSDKRKSGSKSPCPKLKKINLTTNSSVGKHNSKSYDYMTKLNYLFRDTRFFLIKSTNSENVEISKNKNCWSTLSQNETNLNQAYRESRNVLLIFSVNESGKFAGFARMSGESRRDLPPVPWVLPSSISSKSFGGVIEIDWVCQKELSFTCTAHLFNPWNEGKPVKVGRDGQEIEPKVGAELCRLFPEDERIELTPILKKSKENAKILRDKFVKVNYKQPQRSSSGRGRILSGLRRKKGSIPLNRNKIPGNSSSQPPSHNSYKRSSSPYNRDRVHPWERYVTSTAAAEAYVADYMRSMQHQLPPMPYVPPTAFGNIMPPNTNTVNSSSIYDVIPPPPPRYYDGPPLPDYSLSTPPPPIRLPPPGYDKRPPFDRSIDEFMWKSKDRSSSSNSGNNSGINYRNRDFPKGRDRGRDRRSHSDREHNPRDRSYYRNNYRDRR